MNIPPNPQWFAAEAAQRPGLLGALGIDWRLLLLQGAAFLLLVWFLGRFVYPVLIKAIDERQKSLESASAAAAAAEAQAARAEAAADKTLQEARRQAEDIIQTAHHEALAMQEAAEAKAKKRAEFIARQTGEQLEQTVLAARRHLLGEVRQLVAEATEKLVGQKMNSTADRRLIEQALKQSEERR
ncbi:MAG: ATP synthase F0 subunit B [Candidatus Chaera renei]|uniref:ATP synthase subunit b n=1 Tax=Candidatus Chaera renei TaxID=2506947 RepID=A0A4Q0AIV4_9BACT|nr:MAG: ATP synthase F0 subunit B [Candidatus Chaera renei]